MQTIINGHAYGFSADVLSRSDSREGYFRLADAIFGLKLANWYRSGYWDDTFIPYVLYDGDVAVSSVAVCVNDVTWQNVNKRYVQISTVMTLPGYRGRGLCRWLMEYVLKAWHDKCDAVYLLANDSVVDFYPKFGFAEFTEYDFTIPVKKIESKCRKLDTTSADDMRLLLEKYRLTNPFAELKVNNRGQFMFHCLQFLSENIYYLERFDAVAIASCDGNKLICYDVFTDSGCRLGEVLGALANAATEFACLGFTPSAAEGCTIKESEEEDNHLFVLTGKENIFEHNKVIFPLLSRA